MYQNYNDISYAESPFGTLNQYMTKTFGWMFAGLLVTFAVAIGAISTGLVYAFINSGVFFITCIAELILVGVLSARVTSLQPGTATGIFFAYAALNGLNLCSIFLIYDLGSLVLAFLVGRCLLRRYGRVRCYHQPQPGRLGPQIDGRFDCHYHLLPWLAACSACLASALALVICCSAPLVCSCSWV